MRRKGFSLIELLIVVAIIAALVGVAVPFFQDNLQQAQQTKAKQDLDTIRNAISLHDAQNRPLVGTSLDPLVGRYLQELPKDPWGNDYLLDANVGLIVSFGADNQGGGLGGDEDQYFFYKPELRIQRAQYKGSWGVPRQNNQLIMTMTKPFVLETPADLYAGLNLLTNTRDAGDGGQVSMTALGASAGTEQTWVTGSAIFDAATGLLVLEQTKAVIAGSSQPWTPTMAVNFTVPFDLTTAGLTVFGLTEMWLINGPMDDAVFGSKVQTPFLQHTGGYRRSPMPVPIFEVEGLEYNRGVKLERF